MRQQLHLTDWSQEEIPELYRRIPRLVGIKSSLHIPLLREGECLGVMVLVRSTAGGFDAKEIALAQSFADQAVIAIENVRLFNDTKEALERQTATAEVLQVISGSMADPQPVFDRILASAEDLFDAHVLGIYLVGDDAMVHRAALRGPDTDAHRGAVPDPARGDRHRHRDRAGPRRELSRRAQR